MKNNWKYMKSNSCFQQWSCHRLPGYYTCIWSWDDSAEDAKIHLVICGCVLTAAGIPDLSTVVFCSQQGWNSAKSYTLDMYTKLWREKSSEKAKGMSTNGIHAVTAVNHFWLSPHPCVCIFHCRHMFPTDPHAGQALRSVIWHKLWEARWPLW